MTDLPKVIGIKRDEEGKIVDGSAPLNPNGRPKGTFSLVGMLKAEMQKCPEGEDKRTYADLLIKRILKAAIEEGNDQQIKNILQYVEGMPKQTIQHEGGFFSTDKLKIQILDENSVEPETEPSAETSERPTVS